MTTDGSHGKPKAPGEWFTKDPRIKKEDKQLQATSKPQVEVSTDEKRAYLRKWALEQAQGDPARLPPIREARIEVKRFFGEESLGSGLGTDIIGKVLRELRTELHDALNKKKYADGVVLAAVGNESSTPWLARLAAIAHAMHAEGIQTLSIDENTGEPLEFKRFMKKEG